MAGTPSKDTADKEDRIIQFSSQFWRSDIVELVVGKEQQILRVHRDLLCCKSKFFDACLKPSFVEGQENRITLKDDPVVAVEVFVEWLYTHKIAEVEKDQVLHVIEKFKFADMIGCEIYYNDLMDAIRKHHVTHAKYFLPHIVFALYDIGMSNNNVARYALLQVVQQMMAHSGTFQKQDAEAKFILKWSQKPELMQDFVKEIFRYQQAPYGQPSHYNGCHFHEHKDGSKCSVDDKK